MTCCFTRFPDRSSLHQVGPSEASSRLSMTPLQLLTSIHGWELQWGKCQVPVLWALRKALASEEETDGRVGDEGEKTRIVSCPATTACYHPHDDVRRRCEPGLRTSGFFPNPPRGSSCFLTTGVIRRAAAAASVYRTSSSASLACGSFTMPPTRPPVDTKLRLNLRMESEGRAIRHQSFTDAHWQLGPL